MSDDDTRVVTLEIEGRCATVFVALVEVRVPADAKKKEVVEYFMKRAKDDPNCDLRLANVVHEQHYGTKCTKVRKWYEDGEAPDVDLAYVARGVLKAKPDGEGKPSEEI